MAVLTVALSAAPALASRGHTFKETVGTPCPSLPCVGAQLKEPGGVAVNLSTEGATVGDVYVVDKGARRVVRFGPGPERAFLGEITGPSATGSGKLTAGSEVVEEAFATAGAFTQGETVEGEGIPAGTTILEAPGGGVLKLSNAVEAGKSALGATLTAHQTFEDPSEVAVDSSTSGEDPSAGDVYVIDKGLPTDPGPRVVDKFTASGEYLGQISGFTSEPERQFSRLDGVAVDRTGRLWVAAEGQSEQGVGVFSNELLNVLVEPFFQTEAARPQEPGLALDSTEAFYSGKVTSFSEPVQVWKFAGGSSGGVVDAVRKFRFPTEPGGFGVEPGGASDLYVSVGGVVERYGGSDGKLVESFGTSHLTGGGGVAVDGAGSVFAADGAAGVVDVFALEPPRAPTVESEGVTDVSGTSATLQAALNARGAQGTFTFQYGRCASLQSCAGAAFEPAGSGSLPADFVVRGESVHLQGLTAGSAYHYRVVSSNTVGAVEGEERTFTTQALAGGGLPDARRWEMITPPDKHGGLVEPIGAPVGLGAPTEHVTQAALNGTAFTFGVSSPTEDDPAGNANMAQILAARGPAGWSTTDIAGAHVSPPGIVFNGEEFRFFSEDLSAGIDQPLGSFTPSLSAAASEQTAYLRRDYLNGNVGEPCVAGGATSCYTPLVTGCPAGGAPCPLAVAEHQDVPAGTMFGQGECPPEGKPTNLLCGPQFMSASPDGTHVVMQSKAPLVQGAPQESLYEWHGGQLQLVSVLPDATPAQGRPVVGWLGRSMRGAVSDDGSRVIWSQGGAEGPLFLRDMARGETVELDKIQGGTLGGGPEPEFQFASRDGSRVFFTDSQPLTEDSGAGTSGGAGGRATDLFECVMVVVGEKLTCQLHDLTPAVEGKPADVRGEVLGGSDDGATVYFVANGVLASGAKPGLCAGNGSVTGAGCSLYVWDQGTTRFVARLSSEDYRDWDDRSTTRPLADMTSRVSPDGRFIAFMSEAGLSGFDTTDAARGTPVEEVYLFDRTRPLATAGPGVAGNPTCVSCNPTGARPTGVEYSQLEKEGTDGLFEAWEKTRLIGGSVPGWTQYSAASLYQPRYLTDSGRVFFNTPEALVPGDVNGAGDVYEFEPAGVPAASKAACTSETPGYSDRTGGCVGLISSGEAAGETGFLDASASGADVFFFTNGKLARADSDQSRDVYDAHECTETSPCAPEAAVPPPPCATTDSCKAAPTPQPGIFGNPASATFSGPGNQTPPPPPKGRTAAQIRAEKLKVALKLCRKKHNRHKREVCEKAAHKAYGAKAAKRARRR